MALLQDYTADVDRAENYTVASHCSETTKSNAGIHHKRVKRHALFLLFPKKIAPYNSKSRKTHPLCLTYWDEQKPNKWYGVFFIIPTQLIPSSLWFETHKFMHIQHNIVMLGRVFLSILI